MLTNEAITRGLCGTEWKRPRRIFASGGHRCRERPSLSSWSRHDLHQGRYLRLQSHHHAGRRPSSHHGWRDDLHGIGRHGVHRLSELQRPRVVHRDHRVKPLENGLVHRSWSGHFSSYNTVQNNIGHGISIIASGAGAISGVDVIYNVIVNNASSAIVVDDARWDAFADDLFDTLGLELAA